MQSMPFASAGAGQHCAPTMGNKMALLKQPGLELYLINEALAIKGQVRECVMVTERDALKGRTKKMVVQNKHAVNENPVMPPFPEDTDMAMFGMGCFWGAEKLFWNMEGVYSTQVGYAMGYTPNPMYREVCSEKTGHAEVVRVVYYPNEVNYVDLLTCFWQNHDPTMGMAQGNDIGTRYRSGIYYYTPLQKSLAEQSKELYGDQLTEFNYKPITTEILPAGEFYYAEDYHQQYLHKNAGGYCGDGGTGIPCTLRILKTPTPEGVSLKTQLSGIDNGATNDDTERSRKYDDKNLAAGNHGLDHVANSHAAGKESSRKHDDNNLAAGSHVATSHAADKERSKKHDDKKQDPKRVALKKEK